MGLKTNLCFMTFGYILAAFLQLSISWFLVVLISFYLLINQLFCSQSSSFNRQLLRQQQREQRSRSQRISDNTEYNSKDGVACVNNIIQTIWKGWRSEGIREQINKWIQENKPLKGIMESLMVSNIDIANDYPPIVTMIQCIEHTEQSTVIEARFEYSSPMVFEWTMRPIVLPFDLPCVVRELTVFGKLRIQIYYSQIEGESAKDAINDVKISRVDISLSEYPEINGTLRVFDVLDFNSLANSIPYLTYALKKRFRESVRLVVYPNMIPLYASDDNLLLQGLSSTLLNSSHKSTAGHQRKLQMRFDKSDMEDLEDELKKNLLDINQLLKIVEQNTTDISSETVKVEVCESVLRFLKAGQEPGRIPASMMDTVKRAFGILNTLAFGEEPAEKDNLLPSNPLDLLLLKKPKTKKEVDEQVLDVMLRSENMSFIGEVCRTCSLADDLIRNIFRIQDPKQRTKVNQVLNKLNLQDVPLIVMNRAVYK
jgi:type IV secretory pathway VirB3-like protein